MHGRTDVTCSGPESYRPTEEVLGTYSTKVLSPSQPKTKLKLETKRVNSANPQVYIILDDFRTFALVIPEVARASNQ